MNRRHFCKIANLAVLGGVMGLSKPAAALLSLPTGPSRSLSLYSIQTREHVDQVFWSRGRYLADGLTRINHVLRDFRTDEVKDIDPRLLDLMSRLADHLGVPPTYHVISGYRSARTNAMLAKRSSNVAKRSYHLLGQAVDVRMPGVKLADLHAAARDLKLGGVGYYPGPDFVHVDVGPVRSW